MKKILVPSLLLTMVLGMMVASPVVFAATASPSASPKASASPTASPGESTDPNSTETTEKLKERIDKVIEQQKDKVKGVMDSLGLKKRAQVGEVQRVTESSITFKTSKGSQIIAITPQLVLVRDNKKATIDDIAIGDWVIALGYQKGDEFQPKRLQISSTSPRPAKVDALIGTLRSNTKNQVQLLGRFDKQLHAYLIAKTTVFQDQRGTGIKREELKLDAAYILLSTFNNSTSSATIIRSLAQ